jgi:hypothetical protein
VSVRIVGIAALLLVLSASAWAQDPCGECRKAAAAEKGKCDAAAKAGAALELCVKQINEAMLACQLGACKPSVDAQMAALCPDCQSKVSDEEKHCRAMSPGSVEQAACAQRASRMRAACDEKYCRHVAPK